MFPSLKAVVALLSLLQIISSASVTHHEHKRILSEITSQVRLLSSGAQVPCNDTRVAQVTFTDRKVPDRELLCQAARALGAVTRCREDYEPLITNLRGLQGAGNCSLTSENEIYLRHFLPQLGNFTQGMFRRWGRGPQ